MGGFGGSALAAIHIMKANRAMLGKRKKGTLSFVSSKNEKWVDHKTASFEQLMEIRKRIRREQKIRQRKILLITLFVISIVLTAIGYVLSLPIL